MGFPWGLLERRRVEYPLLRGGIKGGGRLMRVTLAINALRRIKKDTHPRCAAPPSREGLWTGSFLAKPHTHSPPLRGPSLEGGLYPGLPLGEAGSRRGADGRLMRVISAKKQRHSPPLRGPSLEGGLFFRLPLGEAGFRSGADGSLMRVIFGVRNPKHP